jgi:glycerol-3-phosphate acyltransferase PlsY
MPVVGGLLLLVWLVVAVVWRFSSLAALAAAAALPFLAWLFDGRPAMLFLGVLLTMLLFWRHLENIRRLLDGTEGKIGQKVRQADSGAH